VERFRRWYDTPDGKKMVRYTMVSVVAVPVGEVGYLVALQIFGWAPISAGVFGAAFGAIPSYHLNRKWAWGKGGKSHWGKEIIPFWTIAAISAAFSGFTQDVAAGYVKRHHILSLERLTILNGAFLGGFAVLWVIKYIIFNKVLFNVAHHDGQSHTHTEHIEAGLAGAAGAPELP
jgi:putative flippase GtrA